MDKKWLAVIVLLVPILYFVYTIPFLNEINISAGKGFFGVGDTIELPLGRSLVFSVFVSLLVITISFCVSLSFSRVRMDSVKGLFLSVLLIPVLTGNVSVAFIWKIILMDFPFVFESSLKSFFFLSFIQFWQFGTFFIYLIWISQQLVSQNVSQYVAVVRLNIFEKIRDVILPTSYNLIVLLFIMMFSFCFYEEAKIDYVFRGSRGAGTELINGWLSRINQSDSQVNSTYGFINLANYSSLVIGVAFTAVLLSVASINMALRAFFKTKKSFHLPEVGVLGRDLAYILVVLFTIVPYGVVFIKQDVIYSNAFFVLWKPFLYCLLAGGGATLAAITVGMATRIYLQAFMNSFNRKSMYVMLGAFSLTLFPPIIIYKLFFKWMAIVGYSSGGSIYLGWFMGHILTAMPILIAFVLVTHFRLSNKHLDYLTSQKVNFLKVLKDLFIRPFVFDYLLLLIISVLLVWNEDVINNVLSDKIPSFIAAINLSKEGKSGELAVAMNYFMLSCLLSIVGISIWNFILYRLSKNKY